MNKPLKISISISPVDMNDSDWNVQFYSRELPFMSVADIDAAVDFILSRHKEAFKTPELPKMTLADQQQAVQAYWNHIYNG